MPPAPLLERAEAAPDTSFGPWLKEAAILVVDDEPGMRNFLVKTLSSRCRRVEIATNAEEAARWLENSHFDVIILDNVMAGKSGLAWLEELRGGGHFIEVILITAFADLDTAIQALRAGAADFVLKPFRINQILTAIARCLDRSRLHRENFVLKRQLQAMPENDRANHELIGVSPGIRQAREVIARAAPLPTTVLITGESGTGKELAARSLHALSGRADKPFVPVNCAAIAPEVIESELFGHLKGSFTGAASSREGLFFYAQGGTLFLDEVGELPYGLQSKLLRAIEEKKVRPVGAEREIPVDVRLVAATNGDLPQAVSAGLFRQDLYYRLSVLHLHLPPLRERREDVAPLARILMQRISAQLGVAPMELDANVLAELEAYGWPGNVRELRNVIERSLILGEFPDDIVTGDVAAGGSGGVAAAEPANANPDALEAIEKAHMLKVLEASGGNRSEAARRLGISRKTLDRKCTAWNV